MHNNTRSAAFGYIIAIAVPALLLLVHAFYYYPYFVDDAFISMRYAERLVEGKGLTWNDGERVEGYSDLLWVLLVAAFGSMGFDLLGAARGISMASSAVALAAFAYYALRVANLSAKALLYGGVCFALAAPVAIWSLAGLECTLVMALMAWVFIFAFRILEKPNIRYSVLCGAMLALLCLTRPEAPLLTIALAFGLLVGSSARWRDLWPSLFVLCAIPASVYLAQLGFRYMYYGELFANTVHAKIAWTLSRFFNGFNYAVKAIAVFLPLILLILLKLDVISSRRVTLRQAQLVAWVSLVWTLSVVIGGGDFFLGFRHFLPLVPGVIFLVMLCAHSLFSAPARKATGYVFLAYILGCFMWLQFAFKEEHGGAKDTQYWIEDGISLGKALRDKYGDKKPLVAVGMAGVLPFYSGLPSLDMYGLTDADLAKHPGADFGYGFLGHDQLNAPRVLARKPDIIVFFVGKTPPLHEFAEDKGFLSDYRLEHLKLPTYNAAIWVRKDSNKVRP
jgi:hypothetical protein